MPTGSASARPTRGARILLWHAPYGSPASRKGKGRVEEHRGRGHQVVNEGKGKVRTAVAVSGEPRQLSGAQTEEPLVMERAC
jgi:hypothetical protein